MDPQNLAVLASLVALSGLTFLLGAKMWIRYRSRGETPYLYWFLGLLLTGFTLAEEAGVYGGVVTAPILATYFFLVALLVGLLSLGSARMALGSRWFQIYRAYVAGIGLLIAAIAFAIPVPVSVVVGGVIRGSPGLDLILASSLLTFPAAVLMAVTSLVGAWRTHRWNLALIFAGIVVISGAGSLYIVSFPVTLYYAEFLGVVLLFFGFLRIPAPASEPTGTRSVAGSS